MKRATMTIYDYNDTPVVVELPDKEIKSIHVLILSGDEVVRVEFEDGEMLNADASNCRIENFFDGEYTVSGKILADWLDFDPGDSEFVSYNRKEACYGFCHKGAKMDGGAE